MLELGKILLYSFADVVPQDNYTSEIHPQSGANAAKRLFILPIPRPSHIKEERSPDRPETHTAKRELHGKLVDEGKPQFLTHEPEFLPANTPARKTPQVPTSSHNKSSGLFPVVVENPEAGSERASL